MSHDRSAPVGHRFASIRSSGLMVVMRDRVRMVSLGPPIRDSVVGDVVRSIAAPIT